MISFLCYLEKRKSIQTENRLVVATVREVAVWESFVW